MLLSVCKLMSENVSTFASLCPHRNQAEPSEHNKLSAVEERREHGIVFSEEKSLFFFLFFLNFLLHIDAFWQCLWAIMGYL